jgi:hypothetical protein
MAFEEELRRANTVTVAKKIVFDENWDANEMIRSGMLADLANNARGELIGCVYQRISSDTVNKSDIRDG